MTTEYSVVKIPNSTRLELDRIKKSNGLPSYSQVITMLTERQKAKEEIINEVTKGLAEQSIKILLTLSYQLMLGMAKDIQKPLHQITLEDMYNSIQKRGNT